MTQATDTPPPASEAPFTGLPIAGRLAILGTGILPAIAAGTVSVMLPAISDAFGDGTNGLEIKSVATAVGLGMMIGAPLSGFLVDRLGRRPVLLAAAIVFGLVGCGIMLMSELWQIIVARFVIGLASGALGVGTAAVVGDHYSGNQQSRWLGFNAGFATFFILFLSPAVGALFDLGWRYGFTVYAFAVPVALTIAWGIPAGRGRSLPVAEQGRLMPRFDEVPWRALLLAVFMGTLSMGTALYWPFRLREVGVESARDIALYGLPNVLMSGGAAIGYGLIRRYLSVTQMFVAGALLSAVGLTAIAFAASPMAILLGLTVEGLAVGMMTPNLTTFALMVSPAQSRGRAVGLVKGALYGSPFLTQFILEPIAMTGGTAAALWTIAAMAVMIALAVGFGALGMPLRTARA
jgi:predicted MFS family arabinose efflux permease